MFRAHRCKVFTLNSMIKLFLFLFIGLIVSSCTTVYKTERDTFFYSVSNPEDFPKEITRLEEIGRYHPDSTVRAKAHLRLALLYLNHKNPNPDYRRALEELKEYISMDPGGDKVDEARSLLILLKKLEKAQKENEERKRAIQILTRENNLLVEENQRIKETIKEVKSLDMQLEEKRKQIK